MIGIVVVSHSRRLADAAVELALQMVRGTPPPIEVAAGLDDHVLGTDAARVKEAIDRVASPEGVLVIMDLGSAVLSAELALELRGDAGDCPIVLSEAPLVEGLVAAVALAAAGATLAEVAADAGQAGQIKVKLLGVAPPVATAGHLTTVAEASIELALHNEHGLHARPAARFVETVRRFDADVTVRNLTTDGPSVSGRSVSALSTLGVPSGNHDRGDRIGPPSPRSSRRRRRPRAAQLRRNGDGRQVPLSTPSTGARSQHHLASASDPRRRLPSAEASWPPMAQRPAGTPTAERLTAARRDRIGPGRAELDSRPCRPRRRRA